MNGFTNTDIERALQATGWQKEHVDCFAYAWNSFSVSWRPNPRPVVLQVTCSVTAVITGSVSIFPENGDEPPTVLRAGPLPILELCLIQLRGLLLQEVDRQYKAIDTQLQSATHLLSLVNPSMAVGKIS